MTSVDPKYLLPDYIWCKIKPYVPVPQNKKKPGRPRMDDRLALHAICYVLRTGIQWKALPRCLGASSTVHDRFVFWSQQGFFLKIWQLGLLDYDSFKGIDWTWQSMDGCHVVAPRPGDMTGPSYKHRGKSGTSRSLLVDGNGVPLAISLDAANCLDFQMAKKTLLSTVIPRPDPDSVPQHLCLDKGYDYPEIDDLLACYKYIDHIRRKGIDYSSVVPKFRARRWVVERSHSWFNNFRRLIIRWETKSVHYLAMLCFAASIICFRMAYSD